MDEGQSGATYNAIQNGDEDITLKGNFTRELPAAL